MASKISWFASEKGRKLVYYGTWVLGMGLFSTKYLTHTFLLDKYQNVVQMYRTGMGVPVPKKILDRVEEVLKDMKVPNNEREFVKVFTVNGFDMFHAGSTMARTGCIIGTPKNYTYDSLEDVEKSEILVNQRLVPWTTPEGKSLQESVVLSPEAQKYAIASHISVCRTPCVFLLALYPAVATFYAYFLARYFNNSLQLHSRKLHVRGTMYSIVWLFAIGLWSFATDYTTVMYEKKADTAVCALGPDYVRGGVELYNKILSRNIALRKIMGPDGEKIFTAYGNDQALFRHKHLPITDRKSFVELKIKEALPT